MKKWMFAGVVLVAVIVAALMVRDWYFNDKPVDMADEHREDAEYRAGEWNGVMRTPPEVPREHEQRRAAHRYGGATRTGHAKPVPQRAAHQHPRQGGE